MLLVRVPWAWVLFRFCSSRFSSYFTRPKRKSNPDWYEDPRKNLNRLLQKEKITQADLKSMMDHVETTVDLKDFKDADVVIEAAVENMNIKKKYLRL